jgi:hypothetical protein
MATESIPFAPPPQYPAAAVPIPQGIPTEGPASHPDGPPPREYPYELQQHPRPPYSQPSSSTGPPIMNSPPPPSPKPDVYYAPNAAQLYTQAQQQQLLQPQPSTSSSPSADQTATLPSAGAGANHYPSSAGVPRLPPILQVEKQQVTTSATQLASASRRRNEAHFVCPVPGCGSTFTRRFNLRGQSSSLCYPFAILSRLSRRPLAIPYGGETIRLRVARV